MTMTKDNALIALGYPGKKRSFFDTLTIAEIRNRTKELLDPLISSIEKLIAIKVILCWRTILLVKHFRQQNRQKGTEIVCKMCKCMALDNINKKLNVLKEDRAKVEISGALLVRRKLLKELTGSNMWKAGFLRKQMSFDSQWRPAIKQIRFQTGFHQQSTGK